MGCRQAQVRGCIGMLVVSLGTAGRRASGSLVENERAAKWVVSVWTKYLGR